jgi:DOPA 4,5-dioxygenase
MNTNTDITGFHAHIYFDTASREAAARVGEGLGAKFDVRLGRWQSNTRC